MKIIPEWRKAHRMLSVQCMTLASSLLVTWEVLPNDLKASIPQPWVRYGAIALLVLGVVGRLVKQPSVSGKGQQ